MNIEYIYPKHHSDGDHLIGYLGMDDDNAQIVRQSGETTLSGKTQNRNSRGNRLRNLLKMPRTNHTTQDILDGKEDFFTAVHSGKDEDRAEWGFGIKF